MNTTMMRISRKAYVEILGLASQLEHERAEIEARKSEAEQVYYLLTYALESARGNPDYPWDGDVEALIERAKAVIAR